MLDRRRLFSWNVHIQNVLILNDPIREGQYVSAAAWYQVLRASFLPKWRVQKQPHLLEFRHVSSPSRLSLYLEPSAKQSGHHTLGAPVLSLVRRLGADLRRTRRAGWCQKQPSNHSLSLYGTRPACCHQDRGSRRNGQTRREGRASLRRFHREQAPWRAGWRLAPDCPP